MTTIPAIKSDIMSSFCLPAHVFHNKKKTLLPEKKEV